MVPSADCRPTHFYPIVTEEEEAKSRKQFAATPPQKPIIQIITSNVHQELNNFLPKLQPTKSSTFLRFFLPMVVITVIE